MSKPPLPNPSEQPRLFVDADACPVKDDVSRVALRRGLEVYFVANSWMRLDDDPLIKRIVVAEGPDVADDWIAEAAGRDDIVITGDIPLSARCLDRGSHVLGNDGHQFTKDNIGMALAMRDLKSDLREAGEISGGNRPFSKQDRSRFANQLGNLVERLLRAKR